MITTSSNLTILAFFIFYCYKSHQLPLSYSTGHFGINRNLYNRSAGTLDYRDKFKYIYEDNKRVGSILGANSLKEKSFCGYSESLPSNRVKRYILGETKWSKGSLTWRLDGPLPVKIDAYTVNYEIEKAFEVWMKHANLTIQRSRTNYADISIAWFARKHKVTNHKVHDPDFDGPAGTLAHAISPFKAAGESQFSFAHFDAEENWVKNGVKERGGINFFLTAAHEFGHVLGLSHSPVDGSLMHYNYENIMKSHHSGYDLSLDRDDIAGIQFLYGPRYGKPWPTPLPSPNPRPSTSQPIPGFTEVPKIPSICSTGFDAILPIRGEIFFFKGRYCWRFNPKKTVPLEAFLFKRYWYFTEDVEKIDAVYERNDGNITFFIGDQYWMFRGFMNVTEGYPKPLSTLGLPTNLRSIDAVTRWGFNELVYFFSGDQYWRFDERTNKVELDYSRGMKIWKGVPTHLDAAFHWTENRKTYFVKGRGLWQFDDQTMSVVPESPQSTTHYWFKFCKNEEYPDLNAKGTSEPSTREGNGSSSIVFITFSYFVCLFIMLTLIFMFNHSVHIS